MKRYRCPQCRTVYTLRPDTHYRGFWAPWRVILVSLMGKLKHNRWIGRASRQRQQYWWRGLRRQLLQANRGPGRATVSDLKALVAELIIVSTHSVKYRETRPIGSDPYLIFAVPGVGGGDQIAATNSSGGFPWRKPETNGSPCSDSP